MIASAHRHRGFTLIELMCSMVIGSIVLLAAAAMLGSSGEGYERVGGSVASEREARAILTQMSSDFSTARFYKGTLLEKSTTAWRSDKAGFLSLQPAAAQSKEGRIGDLCAVVYYLKDLTYNGVTTRCLMRGFRESSETFKALANENLSPLFVERPQVDEPVAFGVVSFEATPKTLSPTGVWIDWTPNDLIGPGAIDVRITVVRRSLAGRLRTSADWDGGGSAGRFLGDPAKADLNKELQVYSTIIRFGNDEKS